MHLRINLEHENTIDVDDGWITHLQLIPSLTLDEQRIHIGGLMPGDALSMETFHHRLEPGADLSMEAFRELGPFLEAHQCPALRRARWPRVYLCAAEHTHSHCANPARRRAGLIHTQNRRRTNMPKTKSGQQKSTTTVAGIRPPEVRFKAEKEAYEAADPDVWYDEVRLQCLEAVRLTASQFPGLEPAIVHLYQHALHALHQSDPLGELPDCACWQDE